MIPRCLPALIRRSLQELFHRGGDLDNVRLVAKWPVSRNWTCAFGMSFRNASAPAGMKKGSFLPQIASNGGFDFRKYS